MDFRHLGFIKARMVFQLKNNVLSGNLVADSVEQVHIITTLQVPWFKTEVFKMATEAIFIVAKMQTCVKEHEAERVIGFNEVKSIVNSVTIAKEWSRN